MPTASPDGSDTAQFTTVVCTRNRHVQLHRTLRALASQPRNLDVLVVDQSDEDDQELDRLATEWPQLSVIRDAGRGLSRARNIGWREVRTPWVVYVDDDCLPDSEWADQLSSVVSSHPEADLIGCYVDDRESQSASHVSVSIFRPAEEKSVQGRWVRPWDIGLGACFAVKRNALTRLGGFDERLGAGAPEFPGAEDMDLNYRLLRGGGIACVTPRVRVLHEQWRTDQDLSALYRGYFRAWSGFSMKQAKTGDPIGAIWLMWTVVVSISRFFVSGILRRSRLRVSLVWPMLAGLFAGVFKGLARSW